MLDALLQGRAWILLVGLLLAGIVFFNVDLLRLNRSIAVTSEQSEAVSRENARLRRELARLGSSERVQKTALERGLVLPAPGDVRFRDAGDRDARRALANMKAPGKGEEAAPTTGPTPTAAPTPVTPTAPATTPAPVTTPTPPPAATPAPVVPQAPPVVTPPATVTPGSP